MTAKDCYHHGDKCKRRKLYLRLLAGFLAFTILVLFVVFLIWAILRPTKPRFILLDATVNAFNVSTPAAPNDLTSNLQITLSSRNPNDRIGIYYDRLDVYVSYRSQQITPPTLLPCSYQDHKDVITWSPFVCGNSVPVAPHLGAALCQDLVAGTVLINIKVDGRVRFKVGTFISGTYHLNVNCPAYILSGNKNNGIPVGPAIKYQLVQNCHVDV